MISRIVIGRRLYQRVGFGYRTTGVATTPILQAPILVAISSKISRAEPYLSSDEISVQTSEHHGTINMMSNPNLKEDDVF